MGVFAALGAVTLIGFEILRPNNKVSPPFLTASITTIAKCCRLIQFLSKIVYEPRRKYHEVGKAEPPRVSARFPSTCV